MEIITSRENYEIGESVKSLIVFSAEKEAAGILSADLQCTQQTVPVYRRAHSFAAHSAEMIVLPAISVRPFMTDGCTLYASLKKDGIIIDRATADITVYAPSADSSAIPAAITGAMSGFVVGADGLLTENPLIAPTIVLGLIGIIVFHYAHKKKQLT